MITPTTGYSIWTTSCGHATSGCRNWWFTQPPLASRAASIVISGKSLLNTCHSKTSSESCRADASPNRQPNLFAGLLQRNRGLRHFGWKREKQSRDRIKGGKRNLWIIAGIRWGLTPCFLNNLISNPERTLVIIPIRTQQFEAANLSRRAHMLANTGTNVEVANPH